MCYNSADKGLNPTLPNDNWSPGGNMSKPQANIAVIGGTGLYDIEGMSNIRELDIDTPFGKPSDVIVTGDLDGVTVAFLPRHGRGHRIMPKYGQISSSLAEAQISRLEEARKLECQIDSVMASEHPEDLQLLKPAIDRVNSFPSLQHRQVIDVPMGMFKLRYLNMAWEWVVDKLK